MEKDIDALKVAVARVGKDVQTVVSLLSAPNADIEAATAALTSAAQALEALSTPAPTPTP